MASKKKNLNTEVNEMLEEENAIREDTEYTEENKSDTEVSNDEELPVVPREIPDLPIDPENPDAVPNMAGFGEALGSMIGGGGSDFKEVLEQSTQIFERLNGDLEEVKNKLEDYDIVKDSLTATKLYIKLLTKGLLFSDIIFIIAIILILIFK